MPLLNPQIRTRWLPLFLDLPLCSYAHFSFFLRLILHVHISSIHSLHMDKHASSLSRHSYVLCRLQEGVYMLWDIFSVVLTTKIETTTLSDHPRQCDLPTKRRFHHVFFRTVPLLRFCRNLFSLCITTGRVLRNYLIYVKLNKNM